MTSRHDDTRLAFPFIHASAQRGRARLLSRDTARARSGARQYIEWQAWLSADWLLALECRGGRSLPRVRAGCDVTHRPSRRHSTERRRGEGGVRKGGGSNCPLVDLQRDNCNARGFSLYFACVGSGTPTLQFLFYYANNTIGDKLKSLGG